MCLICFRILLVLVCTLDIRLVILLLTFMRVTNVCKVSMFYIQWAMIHLVYLPNNMRFKRANILQLQQKKTLRVTAINWIKWGFHLIGIAKFELLHLNITNGRNGFLSNYSNAITITIQTKRNVLLN